MENFKFLGMVAGIVALIGGGIVYADNHVSCASESIPKSYVTIDDPNSYVGTQQVTSDGYDGTKEICRKNGEVVSENVTLESAQHVTSKGTKQRPTTTVSPTYFDTSNEDDSEDSSDYAPGGYNSVGCPKNQYVSGYYRSNGTYVSGYWRNSPNDNCY